MSATLAELRSMIEEADRLGAPDDARVTNRAALGGLASGLMVEWVPAATVEPAVSTGPEVCPCVDAPTASGDVSFQVDTVEELLCQLVGACGATRFWDELPTDYPFGAGVFQGDVATRLVEAATAAYADLQEPEAYEPNITVITGPQTRGSHQPAVPTTTWGSGTRITVTSTTHGTFR